MIRAVLILACLASPAAGQILGSRQTVDCGSIIDGDMVNSTIQIFCGQTNEQLAEMMRAHHSETLATIAALIPADSRLKAEAIQSFFQIMRQDEVPAEQLRDRLAEIAQRHIQLQDQLAVLEVDDPEIQAEIDAAGAALAADPPDHDQVRAHLAAARDLRREKRETAQALLDDQSREEARIIRSQAELEASVLNRPAAAALYEEAADLFPEGDRAERGENISLAADLLQEHGNKKGDASFVNQAVFHRSRLLAQLDRSAEPVEWAEAQFSLGQVLLDAGTIDYNREQIEHALSAFNAALEEHTRARSPLNWAHAQRFIGEAQKAIGDIAGDSESLKDSIRSYRLALQEYSISCSGKCYAAAQHSLGHALISLASYESSSGHLEAAIDAFQEALKIQDRRLMPSEWAKNQAGLGHAYYAIGSRNGDPEYLDDAVAAYRLALEEESRELDPSSWAIAQGNLGVVLSGLGNLANKPALIEEAIVHYNLSLEDANPEKNINEWLSLKNNVAAALYGIGEITGETSYLERAAITFEEILSVIARDRRSLAWASAQNSLGNIRLALGERSPDNAQLEDAVTAYHVALEEYTRERVPSDWARTTAALSRANALIAERTGRIDMMRQALNDATEAGAVLRQHGHIPLAEYAEWVAGEIEAALADMEAR